MKQPLLFVSAGDPSGDNAVSRVITELRRTNPSLQIFGLGGQRLKFLGQEQLASPEQLSVLGFWEVANQYWFFRTLMHRTVDEIKRRKPSLVLLVDYPGFNLRLAKRLKSLGIPIVYYISPQVWAWGKGRVNVMRDVLDRMLIILPFEQEFFQEHRIPFDYVGHYLMEDIPSEYIASPVPSTGKLALLPGSRRVEVHRMLDIMLRTARLLHKSHGITSTVAAVEGVYDYKTVVAPHREYVSIIYNEPRRVVYESKLVLTASGTATLETGIIGRPMVIMYRTGALTYWIARYLIQLHTIGLINLTLGKKVVPEFVQHDANPARLATALSRYLDNQSYTKSVLDELSKVSQVLGGVGASKRAADIIGEYL